MKCGDGDSRSATIGCSAYRGWTRRRTSRISAASSRKIYPTLVLPGTPLFESWRQGEYTPYDTPTAVELLARMKAIVPPWVRIQRIQRDIPARLIAAGVRSSNVRQLAQRRLAEAGQRCRCLRCREGGRRGTPPAASYGMTETEYTAAGGREVFLLFEEREQDTIAGFLRLRLPAPGSALASPVVRELKVVGAELPIGSPPPAGPALQHRGLGRRLMARAEEISRERGFDSLYVLSAVGSREYYRKLGYASEGPYLMKPLYAGRNPTASSPSPGRNS
jgi:elongator complex protein 3